MVCAILKSRFLLAVAIVAIVQPTGIFAQYTPPEPEDLIIYQVFVDRFNNGDTSNDDGNPRASHSPGNPTGFHGGDIEGIRQKLPYIKGLGANGIWITPIVENVDSYHGYGAYDWYNVDPNFGTMDEVKQFIAEAHDMGIAVFYDMVAGHCGNLVGSYDGGYPGYMGPPGEYTLAWTRGGLQYPPPFDSLDHFHAHGHVGNYFPPEEQIGELFGLDDLKTEGTYVREEMTKIREYWIRETRVDGFRIDTVKHVDVGMWEYLLPRLREEAALYDIPLFTFGEIFGGDDNFMRNYIGQLTGGTYKMDSAVDFQGYYTMGNVFARATGPTAWLSGRHAARQNALGAHNLMMPNFFDNHDVPRFLDVAKENPGRGIEEQHRRLELALTFLMTAPGPPVVYYGTEQGFDGGHDPYNREDMYDGEFEFGPSEGDNFNTTSILYRLTARLAELRKQYAPFRRGSFVTRSADNSGPGQLVFSRIHDGAEVIVAINTRTSAVNTPAFGTSLPTGTEMVNALNPLETLTVGAGGLFPARTLESQDAEIWVPADEFVQPSPEIVSLFPADNEAIVELDTDIRVRFLTPMDTDSVESAVTLLPSVAYESSWDSTSTTLTLDPVADLDARTEYRVSVSKAASDTEGRPVFAAAEATWSTGRGEVPLPPMPATFPPLARTELEITTNGEGSDWGASSALIANSGEVTGANVFVWQDELGDDTGPGGYLYPTNEVFTGSDADIDQFRFAFDETHCHFYIRTEVNPAASFFTPYHGIAIDVNPGGASVALGYDQATQTAGVAEVLPRSDAAPEYQIVFTGPRGATLLDGAGSAVGTPDSAFSQATGEVELRVERGAIGLGGELSGTVVSFYVFTGLETFGSLREVSTSADSWTPGGGIVGTTDPDVFDLAGGSVDEQQDDLSDFDNDYRSTVGRSVIRLSLFDSEPLNGDLWLFY